MTIITSAGTEYPVKACSLIGNEKLHIIFKDMTINQAFAFANNTEETEIITYNADDGIVPVTFEGYTVLNGIAESIIGGVSVTLRKELT